MLFVGDDWAEDHHDLYLMNEAGDRLASRRLPEGWPEFDYCTISSRPTPMTPLRSPSESKPTADCGWRH